LNIENIGNIELEKKKIYFVSDSHLGVPDHKSSLKRERLLVDWLEMVRADASEIFLMGDIFDFWFEYKTVVPKGYVRLFGKLAELTDSGINVHYFSGNHDIWAFDYFDTELNIKVYRKPLILELGSKKLFLAHGDGLGPGDKGYKFLKKVFEAKFNQWLFKWLHPDIGARIALYMSKKSRYANIAREGKKEVSENYEMEMLFKFCKSYIRKDSSIDYFIFGHRHLPVNVEVENGSRFVILGDWLTNFSYAVYDGREIELKFFNE